MTWDFVAVAGNIYQLKNLYTSKTFQPAGKKTDENNGLEQCSFGTEPLQQWEFIPEGKNYSIRLKSTDLYVTVDSSGKTNSGITLQKKQNSELQLFRLIQQNPEF
jgi:hypothetical protein